MVNDCFRMLCCAACAPGFASRADGFTAGLYETIRNNDNKNELAYVHVYTERSKCIRRDRTGGNTKFRKKKIAFDTVYRWYAGGFRSVRPDNFLLKLYVFPKTGISNLLGNNGFPVLNLRGT